MTAHTESNDAMKILLQESDYAFSIMIENGGSTNTDFADFTSSNFIRSFRHIMQKPDLSRAQLAAMLRAAEKRKSRRDNDINWAAFMTKTLQSSANANIRPANES